HAGQRRTHFAADAEDQNIAGQFGECFDDVLSWRAEEVVELVGRLDAVGKRHGFKRRPVGGGEIGSNNGESAIEQRGVWIVGVMVKGSSYCISGLAAAAIVLLRVGIGVHFVAEGWSKVENPKPFSAGFFGNAKGPLAPVYKGLVWDADGLYRLDAETTLAEWNDYRDRVVSHYGFDEKQEKATADTVKRYEGRLKQFLGSKRDEIEEYEKWLERRDANARDRSRELKSLQAHDARIAGETRKLYAELIPTIDRLWKDLDSDLNAIATEEQYHQRGRLAI